MDNYTYQKYDSYNTAYFYLKDKYGFTKGRYLSRFEEKLRGTRTKKERAALEATATEHDMHITLNPVTDPEDREIELLMEQYYLGPSPKRELFFLLVERGILKVTDEDAQ